VAYPCWECFPFMVNFEGDLDRVFDPAGQKSNKE
jgi:hypothetical protein